MSQPTLAVTHVYRTYFPDPPGGLQEAIRQIALSTQQMGVANTVYTLSPRPTPSVLMRPEGRVVREKSWAEPASCNLGGPAAFTTFARLANESDVLHYLYPWPFADVLHATIRPRAPAVMTYISDVVRQRWLGTAYAPLMWRTLSQMRLIVANSPAYVQTSPVLSHPDIRKKVRLIPLGIEESSYDKVGDHTVLERAGLAPGEPFCLFIGVLRYYKGLHALLQAATAVRGRIVIAGSGPEADALKAQARQLGVANVVFVGQVTDAEKVALLSSCRALVLPSHLRSEAYGMVLVEAAMFGKPMVSCEIGTGTSYVNMHEETGFVVPPEMPTALANALNQLLADEALAHRLGAAARQRYERLFSGEALGRAYASLYEEVLDGQVK